MISGVVRDGREPVVRLVLIGAAGQMEEIEAVVDTGFTGELTLPSSVTVLLGLQYPTFQPAVLADGTAVRLRTYPLDILWDGTRRDVSAMEAENVPLIGMALLEGYRLTIDALDGGPVTIEPIP